jgi:hypothetical protein
MLHMLAVFQPIALYRLFAELLSMVHIVHFNTQKEGCCKKGYVWFCIGHTKPKDDSLLPIVRGNLVWHSVQV